jgi:transposase-like protein
MIMHRSTREKRCEDMLFAGMKNLLHSQDIFSMDQFAVKILEILMLLEREDYLKSVNSSVGDKGNGSYERSFKAINKNSLLINIPRTRSGQFKPLTMELLNKQQAQVNELALLLYRKGLSSRDVSEIMKDFFGEQMSYETVNNLSESFSGIRKQWEARQLDAYYKVIFCDALYVNLKRNNSYSKEAVHVIYGVKDDNTRELLLLEVNPTESHAIWGDYFTKLKERGVNEVDLIVADGLAGLSDTARKHFVGCDFQRCVVHKQRNILNKIRPKDKEEVASDIKSVFNNFESSASMIKAEKKLQDFCDKWHDAYPNIARSLQGEEVKDYFTYINYPTEVRRMIYTTNSIENLNRQIRRVTKTKVTFDKAENLLDITFMVIKDFEANNWQKFSVHAFNNWPKKTQPI